MKKLLYILILSPYFIFSQVGINTTTPQETLHVEGTLCVTNTTTKTPNKLAGLDANGTLTDVVVGSNLQLTGNVLSATGGGGGSSAVYLVTTINVPDGPPGEELHNFDINLSGANSDKVVFRLVGRTANYKITGISGGTDGRHIVLFNVSTSNLTLNAEDTDSLAQNRLITLANNVATSGQGTAELVYDGALQRWILIGFRD
ncbi:hypothetical protein [Pseudofulvibacter geojedonensis]|uniref:Uncharacterized protein n=1 Tax=Pseudofulvibacter geojedonensis TaxID=1123758 RepID=A0ABW3I2U6_9FLAO